MLARLRCFPSVLILLLTFAASGQTSSPAPLQTTPSGTERFTEKEAPLPDVAALMQEVEAHQREAEVIRKNYIYRQALHFDALDGKGNVKHTEMEESDVFYVGGVKVEKTIQKNGKALSESEKKKEDEKIDKEVRKAQEKKAKAETRGQKTDSNGDEVLTVSRILELGRFTNERRVALNGRDTIVADYTGDQQAKTRNPAEGLVRDLVGTVWIDEKDKALAQAEGTITKDFKIGAGLLFDIRKGTSFSAKNAKVNDEVWLPSVIDAQGKMRALLFLSFDGKAHIVYSDYRKFKATATILPGVNKVEEEQPK